jgi:hypothetical protein
MTVSSSEDSDDNALLWELQVIFPGQGIMSSSEPWPSFRLDAMGKESMSNG